jgi:hypothetical protein
MASWFDLRRMAMLGRATLAMPFAAGVCAQSIMTTPDGLEIVPGQGVITTPGGLQVIPLSPPAPLFGAIAYQRESGAVELSYDYPTARDADLNALSRCGVPRCVVVLSVSSTCGALASGPQGAFTAAGITREAAEQGARSACNDPTCSIAAWTCTK